MESASWAATMERPVARTAMMLLNCILSDVGDDRNRLTGTLDVVGEVR